MTVFFARCLTRVLMHRAVDIPRAVANFRFYASAVLHEETQSTQVQGTAITWTVNQVCVL